ncbi:MAG: Abi family protein [Rhizobium sp.]|nr:Abi family protein [Rhizobium sp.]
MAASQHQFEYGSQKEQSLKTSLSPERIGRYLKKANFDFAYAMDIYLWNARLAKSLQFPLHALEVTLRNAVNQHLSLNNFPADWAFDIPSLDRLRIANPELNQSLNKSKSRLLWGKMSRTDHHNKVVLPQHLYIPSFNLISTNDVIAAMSLEFWCSLLDKQFEYDWRPTFRTVFPNAATNEYRSDMWLTLQPIKNLRNRIAHHEPLFDMKNLPSLHADILAVIGKRCAMTTGWTKHHSTFASTWHAIPQKKRSIGRLLTEIASPCAEVTSDDCRIPDLIAKMETGKRRDFVIFRKNGELGLMVADDLIRWFKHSMQDELVEMRATLADVVQNLTPSTRIAFTDSSVTTGDAKRLFFDNTTPSKNRPTAIIITTTGGGSGDPIAVVFKPDYQG